MTRPPWLVTWRLWVVNTFALHSFIPSEARTKHPQRDADVRQTKLFSVTNVTNRRPKTFGEIDTSVAPFRTTVSGVGLNYVERFASISTVALCIVNNACDACNIGHFAFFNRGVPVKQCFIVNPQVRRPRHVTQHLFSSRRWTSILYVTITRCWCDF